MLVSRFLAARRAFLPHLVRSPSIAMSSPPRTAAAASSEAEAQNPQPLGERKCQACEGGIPALSADEARALHREIPTWELTQDSEGTPIIRKGFRAKTFARALELVNLVGKVAEEEGHHPDLAIFSYNKVKIELTTHSAKGLTENDFILAAKIDGLGAVIGDMLSKKRTYTDP